MSDPGDHSGYTLADLQRIREEMEMSRRLYLIGREHKMRQLLGDDVYDFVQGGRVRPTPVQRAARTLSTIQDVMRQLIGEEDS